MSKHPIFHSALLLAGCITLLTLPSCRKVYDFVRDHPDAHDTLCRITRLSYGSPDTNHLDFSTPQFEITYNAKGNPVGILMVDKLTPYYALEQHFRYDRFDRLTDFILNYAGGPDVITYIPSAIIWHKYAYPRPGIVTDTFLTYTSSPIDGPPPFAQPGQLIYLYKFDAAGKMIATAQTSFLPNQPPPVFSPIAYDARGNKDLSIYTDIVYDNSINIYRTNKVFQFVYQDYSRNNPTRTGISPTNQFGLPTQLPLIYEGPVPNFDEYFSFAYTYYIYYACSAPKGPIDY
jgi:hypothetical protein